MRWLSNSPNPDDPDAGNCIAREGDESQHEAALHWRHWISIHVIGLPQATSECTSEQLTEMGLVGVYSPD